MQQYSFLTEFKYTMGKRAAFIGLAAGGWMLNKFIRTQKVISQYPTPKDLRTKLENSGVSALIGISRELTDDMTPHQYRNWVSTKVNPKMGIGKAILTVLFPIASATTQAGKAVYHSLEDGNDIVHRSYNKGRMIYNN